MSFRPITTTNLVRKRLPFIFTITISYLITLLLCFILSIIIFNQIWLQQMAFVHTILEVVCIFIALCTFIIVWYTYDSNPVNLNLLGLGFLVVAIYDIFHVLYFPALNLYPNNYYDLGAKFWVMGRFAEAIIIFLIAANVFTFNIRKKGISLFIILFVAIVPSVTIIMFYDLFPILLTKGGLTPLKVILEYIIIGIHLASIILLSKKIHTNEIISYRFILAALFIAIPGEITFTVFNSLDSLPMTVGHVLKILYYYFLFQGIVVSCITYPHRRLQETVNFMNTTLDQLPNGLTMYDEDGRVSFVNRTAKEILKYTKDDLIGLTLDEMEEKFNITEATSTNPIRSAYESSKSVETVRDYLNGEGKRVKISERINKVQNGVLVLFNEAKTEQEMRNLQLQTRTILDSISNIVLMYDNFGRIVMCNRVFEETTGINTLDIVGIKVEELWNTLFNPRVDLENDASSSGVQKEIVFITPTGEKIELLYHSAPVVNVDGETVGTIMIASDITELREQQRVIIQQEKLAMLGQMGASIVHETKNFLSTIKGGSQLLTLIANDVQIKKIAQKIDGATDDVNRIITDFLLLSKPKETIYTATSINGLIESIKPILETSSFMKGANIRLCVAEHEKKVLCDESQIKQVIFNIAKNGIEAMAEMKGSLLIISTYLNEITKEMVIEIKDNGKGIPNDVKANIGTPFFTTKDKGTGLGLSVCYRIIKEHKGNITIDSRVDVGTSFIISLPYFENL